MSMFLRLHLCLRSWKAKIYAKCLEGARFHINADPAMTCLVRGLSPGFFRVILCWEGDSWLFSCLFSLLLLISQGSFGTICCYPGINSSQHVIAEPEEGFSCVQYITRQIEQLVDRESQDKMPQHQRWRKNLLLERLQRTTGLCHVRFHGSSHVMFASTWYH
jgi:hypothetical protein